MSSFSVDFNKNYAKRRPDEPRSHYAQRLKFINELRRNEEISDERTEVLSQCYTNVKFLKNTYAAEIMEILKRYDPDVIAAISTGTGIAHMKTPR
jgi:adenosylmethionine-8-amino-7-oxononanoate aminotransferase